MKVRALTDIPQHGVKAGQFFEIEDGEAKSLVAGGFADDKATEAAVYGSKIPPAKVVSGDQAQTPQEQAEAAEAALAAAEAEAKAAEAALTQAGSAPAADAATGTSKGKK
jgi:hypothetical protein